ncbi:MAG: hypothetical protein J0I61_25750 [Bosea sp.]|nr:hypothetical protein [Bosea sp. (in: a-proteobacteria)]
MFGWPIFNRNKSSGAAHEEKSLSLSDPAIAELFGAIPTASGVSVTPYSALKVPAVYQAVRLISENVGSLPCKLYRDVDGSKEAAKDHAGNRLAHNVNGGAKPGQCGGVKAGHWRQALADMARAPIGALAISRCRG